MGLRRIAVLASMLPALGCGAVPPAAPSATAAVPAATETYRSEEYGFAITYPATLQATPSFARSYLQAGGWNVFAAPGSGRTSATGTPATGTPVVALVMPGSDRVTAGELRIGVSRAPADLASCTTVPMGGRPDSRSTEIIDGTPFTTFEGGDAGMNHYLAVKSYRAVRDGTCYAIDVLVAGTNPEVYDPPATPPFTQAEAFAELTPVVGRFRFVGPGSGGG